MCLWPRGFFPATPEEIPIEIRAHDATLDELIKEYMNLADNFDAANIFLSESNIKFGRLNYIEKFILSKTPLTNAQKVLYREFLEYKRTIDLLVLPDKFKPKQSPSKKALVPVAPNYPVIYKVKDDKNKKKYRSVLIITRSDTTGFTAKHLEIQDQHKNQN